MLHKVSNALVESTNTKLRVLHRMAFGFRDPEHLIALALLDRGGYCPPAARPFISGACAAFLNRVRAGFPEE